MKSSIVSSLAAFAIIVAVGLGTVIFMMASGIIEQKLYKESFIVTEVGACNDNSCSIKMKKTSDGTIWDGLSRDLVVEGSYVFLVCNKNYITNNVHCDGFYTFPQAKAYPLSPTSQEPVDEE